MPRTAPRWPLAALLLVLLSSFAPLPGAEAQAGGGVTVNVVSARSLGCSPDGFTSPDLRVRVLVNGAEALVTEKAADQSEPAFGAHATINVPTGARVSVEVHEAEPGGFFLLGTDWVECDVAQGAGAHHNHTYGGGAAERVVARGDGPRAAEAIVVIGRPSAPAPTARVDGVGTSKATLSWDAPSSAQATGWRVAHGDAGRVVATLPASATRAELTGLCDNREYALRVLRASDPWLLSSQDVTFTTANAPPQPARVLRADTSGGNAAVSWESATTHDVQAFEVHASADAAFTPTNATLRGTADDFQDRLDVALRQGDAHVRIRTLDTGGLAAVSPAFALGAPEQESTFPPPRQDCLTLQVGGAIAPQPPATATPSAGTPAGTTPPATPTPTADEEGTQEEDDASKEHTVILMRLAVILVPGAVVGAILVMAFRR